MHRYVLEQFKNRYGAEATHVARAPGRVNLIGEHTDYNDGFVLPIAIDRAIWIAFRRRSDRCVMVHSLDYESTIRFDLDDIRNSGEEWGEYVKGVAWALQDAGHVLSGWEGVMAGNIPSGAGLSSSAAVELAAESAFASVSDLEWTATDMARIGQRVENEWIGVNCGIMDQMIVAAGEAGRALLIDCRTLEFRPAPLPSRAAVVVMDTGTRRGLVDSAYNERRIQCETAARILGVSALRDVTSDELESAGGVMPDVVRRRARHVVSENQRTLEAVEAMASGDLGRLGRLMDESHISLRDDFEVSGRELNVIVEAAWEHPACYGARMTGGGFAGCAVALIEADEAESFTRLVSVAYREKTNLEPQLYVCRPAEGTRVVPS